MENNLILIDTSVLIDYFRKTDKANSYFINLVDRQFNFSISLITYYEIYVGATASQYDFWQKCLGNISVISLDEKIADVAVSINHFLKQKKCQIPIADLFIAATAIANNLPISTLNIKHFERIDNLKIVE